MYITDNLVLDFFSREDAQDKKYKSWFHNENVTKHNSHGLFPQTEADMKSFLDGLGTERIVWKILVKDSVWQSEGIHPVNWIGNCSLQSFNWINRSAELAIIIGVPGQWGNGIGEQSCRIMLHHGFNKLNLHRIWTGTAATNIGMQKVAHKIGMVEEGRFKDGMFLDGDYVDVVCYGITNK